MNFFASNPVLRIASLSLVLALGVSLCGCTHPSAANIELRKQNAGLRDQIAELNRQHDGDVATIRGLESSRATTVPTLSGEQLDHLFTVYGIQLGKLTGGADLDPQSSGDEGLKIYAAPIDQDGQPLKAAGAFTVEAFDLSDNGKKIGEWKFPVSDARKLWYGHAMLYTYVLTCPWQTIPSHESLTIKTTFIDELTGRIFEVQKPVKIALSTSRPTTSSTTRP
jgi:hypothetical protein